MPRGVKEVVCAVPNLALGGAVAGRVVLELLRTDGSSVGLARAHVRARAASALFLSVWRISTCWLRWSAP